MDFKRVRLLLHEYKTKTKTLNMKKVLVAVAVVAFFASCKKDYSCDCTILGTTTKTAIKDAKKKDATDACDALDTSAKILGGSCTLN